MTSPIQDIDTALYAALNISAITNLATGGVWNKIAAEGAELPLVIFQWQGGGDENMTPRRSRNPVYTVKALTLANDDGLAIDAQIDLTLHHQTLTVAGWSNFWTAREGDVSYVETDATGRVIYHNGGMYRLRIAK